MKVGILTFQNTGNFGAVLQAYSLCSYLKSKGVNVSIINYHNMEIEKREFTWNDFKISYFLNPKKLIKILYIDRYMKKKYQNFQSFLYDSVSGKGEKEYFKENRDEIINDYDVIIVGSDQVWNTNITGGDTTYFLDFADDKVKKLSYAASIGDVDNIKPEEIMKLIDRFNLISVREYQAKRYIEEKLDKRVSLVGDPTLLMSNAYWKKRSRKPRYTNYLLLYFYDANLETAARNYAKKNGLRVVTISYGLLHHGYTKVSPTTIEEILGLIENATVVFTSSFHAVMFSIYFHTPFYAQNTRNPARIENILNQFNIINKDVNASIAEMKDVNWNEVDEKLLSLKESSEEYLDLLVRLINE